ncbi:conserved domain protein [Weissella oryzae SG25]|uniref:Conserved domain protein n=1 Tax=Weissella oryzae (strain DSM 25784 / JCM 18191 / LMG 30913 / SG25) TaxID=1329250 RepID=A0A069CTF8_WEIOS|nr:hypothetical protein [Weissella oryzae]GAK30744.1 conserved domain protein [Weissella oryzae SG25]
MIYAVGKVSGKVYGANETKCLLFQNLQKNYPSKAGQIYPEPILLMVNHDRVLNYKYQLT